jgi:hypothetical protein
MREATDEAQRDLYPVRTVLSALAGAVAGAAVAFYAGGELASVVVSEGGFAGLAYVVAAAAFGSVAGAAVAVGLALRHAPGRRVTVVTVLVGGLLVVASSSWLINPVVAVPVTAVILPAIALLGRWLAIRKQADGGHER